MDFIAITCNYLCLHKEIDSMASTHKSQKEILQKLKIDKLNPMQEEAQKAITNNKNTLLLSPTGSGKTLAFLLPIIQELDSSLDGVQVIIIVPSRELAIQINGVLREMGTGYKTSVVYGGRSFGKDKTDMAHPPAILVGTPGRVAAHLRRETVDPSEIKTLVLDEFDKSLEIGFETEMKEIIEYLPHIDKRVLTSATQLSEIPEFVGLKNPQTVNFLKENAENLKIETVASPAKNKLDVLVDLLCHLGDKNGIIFCNFKDTIQFVSDHLEDNDIRHGCFYGGMEQIDRERALMKFRNGTHRIIIATDLAARGIDIPDLQYIIHFQLPLRKEEFTHRNGRTARMHKSGTAYVLHWIKEDLPDFIQEINPTAVDTSTLGNSPLPPTPFWKTIYISGGRQDKISKGDIVGLFFKQGNLNKDELGIIELKKDCAFVAIKASKAADIIHQFNNTRIKKKKVRMKMV